ncbi:MAG: DUF4267 domain-containing protein [Acidimicrobiales bacterium]
MPPLSTRSQLMVAGRLGLGIACLAAPGLVVRLLGFPDRSGTASTFARMIGVRDLGVALFLLATAADPAAHRRAQQIAGLVDVGDVAAVALGAVGDSRLRTAAARNLPFAGTSAIFSFLAARAT